VTCADLDRDLDLYVDRELDAGGDAGARAHLQTCPRCREHVRRRQALSRLVQAAPYFEASPHLRSRVARAAARRYSLRQAVAIAAAAVLVVAGGATALRVATLAGRADAARLVDAHVRALAGDQLFAVRSTDQHTVKPWFAGKLDYSPPVSDPAALGFPLVGGRVDRVAGRPVAVLVYQRRLHVVDVFVAPAGTVFWPRGAAYTVRGYHVLHWTAQDMSFWAVSDLNEAELADFARALGRP
jgi:anti-sigma factor RsiW